ncbi:unnamed protein product [Cuscuta europaea]|uniref:HTH myb-type domain-containing protein n=1 Tax=Cuscuta europaea TaxID=41803 RepID=A0A9P1EC02_CUSEU|nr:unnamed protein product [Cuscuta europaea]
MSVNLCLYAAMGEEPKSAHYETDYGCDGDGNEDRVTEWEEGLPSADDLTPLSQVLIPPELASAFRISPEPSRNTLNVNRASQPAFSSLQGDQSHTLTSPKIFNFNPLNEERRNRERIVADDDTDPSREESEPRKTRRIEFIGGAEEADSPDRNENCGDESSGKTVKRPRLVWTPQLHKRFVDVVAHLGIKNAVPKTIMQLMNVEGLTRENVASHLQKYRLYLKRMQGLSNEGPSSSDHLFASTPVPQSLHESGRSSYGMPPVPIQFQPPPQIVQMIAIAAAVHGQGHNGHYGNANGGMSNSFHHECNLMPQRDWLGNRYGTYHSITPADE